MHNRPYADSRGRLIHYCGAAGCGAWGSFGFPFGVWLCGAHRGEHEKWVAEAAIEAQKPVPEKQGRLL